MRWTLLPRRAGTALMAVLNGAVLVVGLGPSSSAEATPRVVMLYGDSLAWESQDHFESAFAHRPEVDVITKTFGGTAICDWLDVMRTDATAIQPDAVVVEFSGNALTKCMLDADGRPLTGDAYLNRYLADAQAVVAIFESIDARVYFAGAPTPRVTGEDHTGFNGGQLNALYRDVASAPDDRVEYVDAGAAVLDDGRWTASLPCLPDEPCEGGVDADGQAVNLVRAPDGAHFCPTGDAAVAGVTDRCAVWASGAYRFGRSMANPVLDALAA